MTVAHAASRYHSDRRFHRLRICLAGLIAIVLLVVLAVEVFGGAWGSQAQPSESGGEAVVLTEYELLSRAGTIEPTPYWVGPRMGGERFKVEGDAGDNLYLHYLSVSTAGEQGSLTIATYAVEGGRKRLEAAARSEGGRLVRRPGFLVLEAGDSKSAYVAFDERPELQIEVYSPRSGEAARLALSQALGPVRWTPLS